MSLERSCESVELLLLAGQSALSGFSLKHHDEDTQVEKDRITVKSEPAQPGLLASDGVTVKHYLIPVSVSIHLMTPDASRMDALVAAVHAANNTDTPPAAAVTLANADFNGGPRIENMPEGERENEDKRRNFVSRFAFYVSP